MTSLVKIPSCYCEQFSSELVIQCLLVSMVWNTPIIFVYTHVSYLFKHKILSYSSGMVQYSEFKWQTFIDEMLPGCIFTLTILYSFNDIGGSQVSL